MLKVDYLNELHALYSTCVNLTLRIFLFIYLSNLVKNVELGILKVLAITRQCLSINDVRLEAM